MSDPSVSDRRVFVRDTLAGLGGLAASVAGVLGQETPRSRPPARPRPASKRLAVITTAYYYLSHAYHICGRFLDGYFRGGRFHHPDFAIAGMFVEQQKENDLSRELAQKHGFKLCSTVAEALTLGTNSLAVDGVLLIAEHGDYPYNAKGQKLYPRYELFQQIVSVFKRTGRSVPVFCDKHLSYRWAHGREMVRTAADMKFPLMAGSSLPITWRRPELELPLHVKLKQAVVASRGELEIFGIHALEALQCMVERRCPRDQGVAAVTCLEGAEVWKAGDQGRFSWALLEHALGRSDSLNVGDIRDNCRQFIPPTNRPTFPSSPVAFLIEYRDGLRATVLLLNGHVDDTTCAVELEGSAKPQSTLFYLPPPPGASFLQALTVHIEDFLSTAKPPYPVERTLLTGGILDFVLESRVKRQRLETPELAVAYEPPTDSGFMRGSWTNPA